MSGRKYSHINCYDFAMTLISHDNHLTAGAWAAYGVTKSYLKRCLTRLLLYIHPQPLTLIVRLHLDFRAEFETDY